MSHASATFTSLYKLIHCATLVSIMNTVLYGVCVNDLFIHDHVASTLEHAELESIIFNAIKVGVPTM